MDPILVLFATFADTESATHVGYFCTLDGGVRSSRAAENSDFSVPPWKSGPLGPRKPLKMNLGFSPRRRYFFDQPSFSAYCLAAEVTVGRKK